MSRPIVLAPNGRKIGEQAAAATPSSGLYRMPHAAAGPSAAPNGGLKTLTVSTLSAPAPAGFFSPGLATGSSASASSQPASAGPPYVAYEAPASADTVRASFVESMDAAHVALSFAVQVSSESRLRALVAAAAAAHPLVRSEVTAVAAAPAAAASSNEDRQQFVVSAEGAPGAVHAVRSLVLRDLPVEQVGFAQAPSADVLADGGGGGKELKREIRAQLDGIAAAHGVAITLVDATLLAVVSRKGGEVTLQIKGGGARVDAAKVDLLVLFDELAGLRSLRFELPSRLIPLVCGRQRVALDALMREHGTNVYLPSTLQAAGEHARGAITVTGSTAAAVEATRAQLLALAAKMEAIAISKRAPMVPQKLEWIMATSWHRIREVMDITGTFIAFPPAGEPVDAVTIVGDKPALMARALTMLMELSATQIAASIFLDEKRNKESKEKLAALKNVQLPGLAGATGAEVLLDKCHVRFFGEEGDVLEALQRATAELEAVRRCARETVLALELASEHRDFITGKKNGKMNKVMRDSGARVAFSDFSAANMVIEVASDGAARAAEGFRLLKDELPAEISFHVPEGAHKRIIGVGGKNIQQIMKQYGVYVKFSGNADFLALGGVLPNEDNVVVRTPAKNGPSLYSLKATLMALVYGAADAGPMSLNLTVPRRFHHWLTTTKHARVSEIEARTGILVRFPARELGSAVLKLYGVEASAQQAAALVKELLPVQLDYAIPFSAELARFLDSPEWRAKQLGVQHELEVWTTVAATGGANMVNVRMWTARVTAGFLKAAVAQVVELLQSKGIVLTGSQAKELEPPATPLVSRMPQGPILSVGTSAAALAPSAALERAVGSTPLSAGGSIKVQNIASGIFLPSSGSISAGPEASPAEKNWAPSAGRRRFSSIGSGSNAMRLVTAASSPVNVNSSNPAVVSARPPMSPVTAGSTRANDSSNWRRSPGAAVTAAAASPAPAPAPVAASSPVGSAASGSGRSFSPLYSFLRPMGLEKLCAIFNAEEIDFDMLRTLSEGDLKELGVSFGARRKITQALDSLRTTGATNKDTLDSSASRSGKDSSDDAAAATLRVEAKAFQPIPGFPRLEERMQAAAMPGAAGNESRNSRAK